MQRYFDAHKDDPGAAIMHYQCNIELAEAFCSSIAVFDRFEAVAESIEKRILKK